MPANAIRIIGGQWRGRRLRFPHVPALRPTPDRVRETVFNWLGQDLTGRTTLDPFAGSGALSLEALSRGATLAVAVDRDPQLVRALAVIAAKLGTRFSEDHWAQLLPAAAARLATGGMLYVEAPVPIAAPEELTVWRHDKAGQVHYHLLRHTGRG